MIAAVGSLVFLALPQRGALALVGQLSDTTTAYPQAVLADHPTSYYRLDESAGPIASDVSGNGHDATYQSNVQFGVAGALPSESDPAISTTSRNVGLTESGADLPAGDTPRTLEVWINDGGGAAAFDLLRYGDVAGGHGFEVAFGDDAGSIVVTGGAGSVSAPTIGDFQHGWHLVDVTYDGSTVEIYQDGQVIGGGTLAAAGTVTPGQGFRIASNASGMGLDEAAVYPTALSAATIDAHWTAAQSTPQIASCSAVPIQPYPSAVLADSPLMAFRLDELEPSPQGRVAVDYSSHCSNAAYHEHPTSVTGALTGDSDPALGASARGVALAQTGSALPAGSAARTLEGWVRYQCCNATLDFMRYGDVAGGHGFEVALGDNAGAIVVIAGAGSVSALPVGDFQHGWHLVAVTYDGTTVEIYQDGQIIGGGILGAIATVTPGQGLQVASNAAGAGLDEVAVYGSALSPQRINAHFHASTLSAVATRTPTPTPTVTPGPGATSTGPSPSPTATPDVKAIRKCRAAIASGGTALLHAVAKAQAGCEAKIIAGKLQLPLDSTCRTEMHTADAITKAETKLRTTIEKACGGKNKACGTGDGDDVQLADVGWPGGPCPNITGAVCPTAIDDCDDVAACVACIDESAVDQANALYDGELTPTDPKNKADKALNKCQAAIGKAATAFLAAKSTALTRCWNAVNAGKAVGDCPGANETAATTIGKAEAKETTAICKACGGPDKACGGGDDLAPGFAQACPAVVPPGRTSCAGAVATLQQLVACVDCVTEFYADCTTLASVRGLTTYPAACAP